MIRLIKPDDWLLRIAKSFKGHIDLQIHKITPAAFDDKYENLSLFVAKACSPVELYQKFSQYSATKKQCKTTSAPTPEQMYESGYRILRIKAAVIINQGYKFKVDEDGNEYREDGHIDIINGKEGRITWALKATVLNQNESLSTCKGLSW